MNPETSPNQESSEIAVESSEPVWTKETAPEEEAHAREIAGKGSYERIQRELENTGLLGVQMERVAREYEYIFKTEPEVMGESDLEMFTILELYDKGTARHCAETYRIAKEKIEKPLLTLNSDEHERRMSLGDLFQHEEYGKQVSLDQFFRACLLHDIGKVEIPRFVIQHPMNDQQMNMYLRDLVVEHDPEIMNRLEEQGGIRPDVATVEELESYLKEHGLRSVHFVPARLVLSPEECAELVTHGFDPDASLMDIIKEHEVHSEEILANTGLVEESELAGRHHNYRGASSSFPMALSALHMSVDVEELLHIADMKQALSGHRPYQKGNAPLSPLRVLRIIMDEAARGRIREEAAYLWVEDDLHELKMHGEQSLSLEDNANLRAIRNGLEHIRMKLEDSGDPLFGNELIKEAA